MKKLFLMITVAAMMFSCGNSTDNTAKNSTQKKFNPQQKTSKLSDSEKEAAISKKRSSLAAIPLTRQ